MIIINTNEYRIKKMAPREQFHLLRRITPLLATMGTAAMGLLDETKPKGEVMAEILACIEPAAMQLASMDDATVDYVLDACLTNIERKDPASNGWYPVYVRSAGKPAIRMYQDLDGAGEMRLCSEFIKENLSGFFEQLSGGSGLSLSAPKAAQGS